MSQWISSREIRFISVYNASIHSSILVFNGLNAQNRDSRCTIWLNCINNVRQNVVSLYDLMPIMNAYGVRLEHILVGIYSTNYHRRNL